MLKRVLSMCLAFALILAAAGCGVIGDGSSNTNSLTSQQDEKDRVVAEAQAYLEENYPDDVFTYVSGRSPDWAYRYYELAFTSQKYDDQEVIVYGDPKKDENPNSVVTSYYKDEEGRVIYDYYDTYYEYSMKDEAREYLLNLAGNYIKGLSEVNFTFSTTIVASKQIDHCKNFIENIRAGNIDCWICFICTNNLENQEGNIQELLQEFINNGIYASIYFKYKTNSNDDEYMLFTYDTRNGIIAEGVI